MISFSGFLGSSIQREPIFISDGAFPLLAPYKPRRTKITNAKNQNMFEAYR